MDGRYPEANENALVFVAAVPEADRKNQGSEACCHEKQLWLREGDLVGH